MWIGSHCARIGCRNACRSGVGRRPRVLASRQLISPTCPRLGTPGHQIAPCRRRFGRGRTGLLARQHPCKQSEPAPQRRARMHRLHHASPQLPLCSRAGRLATLHAPCTLRARSLPARKSRLAAACSSIGMRYRPLLLVPKGGLEPPRLSALPPQGSASTNSATWAGVLTSCCWLREPAPPGRRSCRQAWPPAARRCSSTRRAAHSGRPERTWQAPPSRPDRCPKPSAHRCG